MVVHVAAVRVRVWVLVGLAVLVGVRMYMFIFWCCLVFGKHLPS